jgi:hypothetical protein
MSELTIDISETTHKILLQLAKTSGNDYGSSHNKVNDWNF